MKYTLLDGEKDKALGEVDHLNGQFEFSGKPVGDIHFQCGEGRLVASQKGYRMAFLVSRVTATGHFQVATALGNMKLQLSRGGLAEIGGGSKRGRDLLKSSMPGKILKVLCTPGQAVEEGTPLLIMEAMKMENEIRSDQVGVVKDIKVAVGQAVESGAPLVQFEVK